MRVLTVTSLPSRLCAEADRHLDSAAARVESAGLSDLVAALSDVDLARTVVDDAFACDPVSSEAADLYDRCDSLRGSWRRACRSPLARQGVAEYVGVTFLSADLEGSCDDWVLWAFYGRPAQSAYSEALLAAFSVLDHPLCGYLLGAGFYCLWCPPALPEAALHAGMVWVCTGQVLPASQAEAEVAASLWTPALEGSAFSEVSVALSSARALLR